MLYINYHALILDKKTSFDIAIVNDGVEKLKATTEPQKQQLIATLLSDLAEDNFSIFAGTGLSAPQALQAGLN